MPTRLGKNVQMSKLSIQALLDVRGRGFALEVLGQECVPLSKHQLSGCLTAVKGMCSHNHLSTEDPRSLSWEQELSRAQLQSAPTSEQPDPGDSVTGMKIFELR